MINTNRTSRAWRALFSLLVLATLAGAGCKDPQTAAATREGFFPGTVKAGHLVALDMAPLFVAKEAGFFKEEGIDLETVFFSNPGDNNAALAGGAIQFSTNPFTLPYFGENSGIPMRIISSAGGLGIIQVIIQGKFGVNSMAELATWVPANRATKLKVGALKGDTLDMILYRSFKEKGLAYTDFEMVWFNDLLAMVQSFQTGQIDILSHIQPYTTELVMKGAKVLTDNSQVWGEGTPNCTVAVLDAFAKKYPKTVEAYLAALHRGFQLIVEDPKRAVELLVKGKYYHVSQEALLTALSQKPKKVVLRPNVQGVMTCINDMVALGYIKQPKTDIMMLDYLDRAELRFKDAK